MSRAVDPLPSARHDSFPHRPPTLRPSHAVRRVACALGVLLASIEPLAAQVQLSTTGGGGPARQIGMLTNVQTIGGGNTFGQSFVAPSDVNSLDSFSFWLNRHHSTAEWNPNITFAAYVMGWDTAVERTVGPVLWQSEAHSGPTMTMQRYDFNTGGIGVTAGGSYIAFLSLSSFFLQMAGGQHGVLMGYMYDPYAQGRFYASHNGSDLSLLGSQAWERDGGCANCDAAFVANFRTTAPEPATVALLGGGLAALGVIAGRRRRRSGAHV